MELYGNDLILTVQYDDGVAQKHRAIMLRAGEVGFFFHSLLFLGSLFLAVKNVWVFFIPFLSLMCFFFFFYLIFFVLN